MLNNISSLLISLVAGIVIGALISAVYIISHKKEGFSQSYVFTLLILPPVIAAMLAMLNGNESVATGIGLAGVFTLCRYRTVPGDPKDITYVFFAMAEGAIIGMSEGQAENIIFAFIFFIAIAAVLLIVAYTQYGKAKTSHMTLKITIPENLNYIGLFDNILDANTTSWRLKKVKTTNFGSLFDLVYSIEIKNDIDQKKFIDDLRKLNGNLTVILSFFKYEDAIYDK
jgi:hypothetical protein